MSNHFIKKHGEIKIVDNFLIRGTLKVDMQEVFDYYMTTNHSYKETLAYFKLTPRMFEKIRKHLNIDKPRILSYEHNKKTLKELYGDEHYNNLAQAQATCQEKYGVINPFQAEEFKEKANETKEERYGDPHFVNHEKAKATCIRVYGVESPNSLESVKAKQRATCRKNFGVDYPMQSKEVQAKYDFDAIAEKAFETKKQNGTTNTSKPQELFISTLKDLFGDNDIETEYKEERYPYHCDVYIKSRDLFIELNLYFTHGGHPYDKNNEQDQKLLAKWIKKSKKSKFFYNAIRVWTELDPEKQRVAKENNLNYLMFYTEQEVKNYIDSLKGEKLC